MPPEGWEDLAVGDPPVGVLWHLETAQLLCVLLPAIDREPLFYLKEEPASEGFPLVAVYGEQGPQVAVSPIRLNSPHPRG